MNISIQIPRPMSCWLQIANSMGKAGGRSIETDMRRKGRQMRSCCTYSHTKKNGGGEEQFLNPFPFVRFLQIK